MEANLSLPGGGANRQPGDLSRKTIQARTSVLIRTCPKMCPLLIQRSAGIITVERDELSTVRRQRDPVKLRKTS